MKELRDRVAVVTGAASGIGRAMAGKLAAEGMRMVLADVEEQPLHAAAKELEASGTQVLAVVTDVSKPGDVDTLADRTLERFGGIHVVCNNAGVAAPGTLWETSLRDWQWTIDVNLWGVIHGVRTFVPLMLERGEEGHIVNTASAAGLAPGTAYLGAYAVTKHGVVALSEALDTELAQAEAHIKVSVLCPNLVRTRIMDAARNRPSGEDTTAAGMRADAFWKMLTAGVDQRGLSPDDVAALVVRAIREEKLYVLPHPPVKEAVRARMAAILEERSITTE